jgi:hypothetical protein
MLSQDARLVRRFESQPLGDDVARALVAHVETEIAPDHHPVGADQVDEVTQGLGRMTDRVVGEPSQIGAEGPPGFVAGLGPHPLTVLEPPKEVGQGPTGVGQAHLQTRKLVQHAAQDQVRRGYSGVERVAE